MQQFLIFSSSLTVFNWNLHNFLSTLSNTQSLLTLFLTSFPNRLFRSFNANWKWKCSSCMEMVFSSADMEGEKHLKALKRISGWKFSCRFHFSAAAHRVFLCFRSGFDDDGASENEYWAKILQCFFCFWKVFCFFICFYLNYCLQIVINFWFNVYKMILY